MSRTNPSGTSSSPVQRYISFKGSTGELKYYDKDSSEEDKNVYLESLDFVVLDVKASILGFNENESCGITSNLLDQYDLGKKEFIVKTKVNGSYGEFTRGLYRDIKDKTFAIGGKFTTNIFALADVGFGMEIVRIDLRGSSLGPWIEYSKNLEDGQDIYKIQFTIKKGILCGRKNGENHEVSDAEYKKVEARLKKNPMADKPVWFYTSAFESKDMTEDMSELADDGDTLLQEYFKGFSDVKDIEVKDAEEIKEECHPSAESEPDDLPF